MQKDFADNATASSEKASTPLTREMMIEPAGTAAIAIYPRDPYDQEYKLQIYGEPVAYITVYSIRFVPSAPDQRELFAKKIESALAKVAKQEPDFNSPVDYRLDAIYQRPKEHSFTKTNSDGLITLWDTLDLDDTWKLYQALYEDGVIQPCEQVAWAMQKAALLEGRGPVLDPDPSEGEIFHDAYNFSRKPDQSIGCYADLNTGEVFNRWITDSARLLALGEITPEDYMRQMLLLAEHTLRGTLSDPDNRFPDMRLLEENGKTEDKTHKDILQERLFELLDLALDGDGSAPDTPYGERLQRAVEKLRSQFTEELKAQNESHFEARTAAWLKNMHNRSKQDWLGDIKNILKDHERALKLSDLLSGYDPDKKQTDKEGNAIPGTDLLPQAELVKAGERIPPQLPGRHIKRDTWKFAIDDQTWEEKEVPVEMPDYVTRNPGDPWPRLELPESLKPFIRENPGFDPARLLKEHFDI